MNYSRNYILRPQHTDAGSSSHPHRLSILPERHLPCCEPVVYSADISSVTVSQTNMSLALDVSLSSLLSIVDVSAASLRRAGVGRMGTGSQMFVLFQWKQMFSLCIHMHTHSHTHMCTVAIQRLGSLPAALLSVIRYRLKTGRANYLVWSFLKHYKSKVLFLGLASTFYGWSW